MITPTPDYVRRDSDELVNRTYLGSVLVPGVRDDVTDEELVSLPVDAAISTAGAEVFAGQYSMTPDVARRLAAALVQVADHLDASRTDPVGLALARIEGKLDNALERKP